MELIRNKEEHTEAYFAKDQVLYFFALASGGEVVVHTVGNEIFTNFSVEKFLALYENGAFSEVRDGFKERYWIRVAKVSSIAMDTNDFSNKDTKIYFEGGDSLKLSDVTLEKVVKQLEAKT